MRLLIAIAALVACSGVWAEPVELSCVSETDDGDEYRGVIFDTESGDIRYARNAGKFKDCKKEESITEAEISCSMGRDLVGVKTLVSVDRFTGVLTVTAVDPFARRTDWHYDCNVKVAEKQKF